MRQETINLAFTAVAILTPLVCVAYFRHWSAKSELELHSVRDAAEAALQAVLRQHEQEMLLTHEKCHRLPKSA